MKAGEASLNKPIRPTIESLGRPYNDEEFHNIIRLQEERQRQEEERRRQEEERRRQEEERRRQELNNITNGNNPLNDLLAWGNR